MMNRRNEVVCVYAAGLLQGIALVTFPAASAVLTSPHHYGLSSREYGLLFVPQVVTAIAAALLGDRLVRRWSAKRVYLVGLAANFAAMALLLGSRFAMSDHPIALVVLLAATTCLGIGFGLTVPVLNNFAAEFFPGKVDRAVLALNALLGLGTALAPVFVAIVVGLGIWWGMPLAVGAFIAVLILASLPLPLRAAVAVSAQRSSSGSQFRMFAAFALLYGVVETLNGNWSIIYLSHTLGASAALASLALTLFWAAATGGRILFAAIERVLPARATFRLLPLVVAVAFVGIALLPHAPGVLGPLAFALAGFGCSALLPLMISLGRRAASAGQLIAFYQMGYGLAAFGAGPAESHAGLRSIFGGGAIVAMALATLAVAIVHRSSARGAPTPSGRAAAVSG
jgi:predicted MFS family arabinose efflux permease